MDSKPDSTAAPAVDEPGTATSSPERDAADGSSRRKRKPDAAAGPPDDSPALSEELAALEAQLQDKEQLVQALTERLEQAAEQLDRVHRTGGDRRAHIGGFPPELVEQQRTLVDELQHAVQTWEDMQAGVALGRIEMQIGELRDLVRDRAWSAPAGASPSAATEERPAAEPPRGSKRPQAEGQEGAGWEALKASLMNADSPADAAEPHVAAEDAPSQAVPDEDLELENAPPPLDPATAGIEELRKAIDLRDEYIAQLARNLRRLNNRHSPPDDWSALADVPDELRERLGQLERQLEENQRLAEVELSLERARLGREAIRLRDWEAQIQKEARHRTADAKTDGDDQDPKGRRWRRMLGMNNKGGQEG